ncbi:MAG: CrcB family protein [Pelagibacteraceae bacterium]|nr:CrcB family protein [Pelagibacteraceae bacterium]HJO13484.1 CrcB family protein [Alphaproteobacteria bacterium]MBO6465905.1 CrcB family protein [Pelagibacteraceae bacterium]MBO6467597.1 CrcB family protein [Pelagibacteraceae bacterium]MBO6470310.1 CrcB family protein [Pelagibacteraceae bacterium]
MINLFYVASGGSLGAVLRYLTSNFYRFYFPNFPFGTLFINFLGSFLIGILASNLENQGTSYAFIKYFLIIGILGSFTTFSTFSLESIQLINDKKLFLLFIYIFLSISLCIFGAFFGFNINKFLL